jgi:hypothetical protein
LSELLLQSTHKISRDIYTIVITVLFKLLLLVLFLIMADGPATKRRKLIVMVAAIGVATIMMKDFQYAPTLPPTITSSSSTIDDLFRNEGEGRRNVGAILLTDNHAGDPRYKSDAIFWDVYNGDDIWFYKEYRMSKTTFNMVVADCIPFLWEEPSTNEETVKSREVRAKVTMAELIRYLATQQDQNSLGKEFGVLQPCISKRIQKGYKDYLWEDYLWDKIHAQRVLEFKKALVCFQYYSHLRREKAIHLCRLSLAWFN